MPTADFKSGAKAPKLNIMIIRIYLQKNLAVSLKIITFVSNS